MWTWIQLLRRLGDELGEPGRNAVRRVAPGVIDALVPEWASRDNISSGVRTAATGFALIEGVVAALCELSGFVRYCSFSTICTSPIPRPSTRCPS